MCFGFEFESGGRRGGGWCAATDALGEVCHVALGVGTYFDHGVGGGEEGGVARREGREEVGEWSWGFGEGELEFRGRRFGRGRWGGG